MSTEFRGPPGLGAVADSWRHFEAEILPEVAEDLPEDIRALSRLSFYFGSLLMLNFLQSVSERAGSPRDLPNVLAASKAEAEAFLMSRTTR